jgi:hypothetical protein
MPGYINVWENETYRLRAEFFHVIRVLPNYYKCLWFSFSPVYRIKDVKFSELGLLGTKLKHAIVIWSKMEFGETPKAALLIIKFFNNKYVI